MPLVEDARSPLLARWVHRTSVWFLPAENPAAAIYGVLLIGALLAAESGLRESHLDSAGSAVLTAAVYWLAHAYSSLLGRRLQGLERLTPEALARALSHAWPLIRGAALPLLAVLLAWVVGGSREAAVAAGMWTAVASLVVFELLAGLDSRASRSELMLQVAIGAAMGFGILLLKRVLH